MLKMIASTMFIICSLASGFAGTTPTDHCQAPDSDVTASVTKYTLEKYHLASASQLLLQESAKANEDCYWRYRYQINTAGNEITLFLAPDHRYLSTALYDRTKDPRDEERAEQTAVKEALNAVKSPNRGPAAAKVTVVEFSDFECPYCQKLTNILEQEVLPSEPDLQVIFKDYPLPMHPWARSAAQLIACAGFQSNDAFWKLHDYAFSNQKSFNVDNVDQQLVQAAENIPGIDIRLFHDCVDRGMSVGLVMKDEELGRKEGVRATPTVFINGARVEGIRDADQLKRLIAMARNGDLLSSDAAPKGVSPSAEQASACKPVVGKGAKDALR